MAPGRSRAPGWLSLLLALLVAACAAGGPLTGPLGGVPGDSVVGADGQPLALSQWPAENPRAVILGVHGYGDYGPSTFREAARYWAERGIITYAYDQRGFGRNPSRGFWPGAEALVDDLVVVAAQIRTRHPCLPLVVVGHSMGGGVALAAAGRRLKADGLVLAAPAIWGGRDMNPLHRMAAWFAAVALPDKRISGRGAVQIKASDNVAALRALGDDPLYLSPPSGREFYGLVQVTDLAADAAPAVTMPALLLLGERDEIVPNESVTDVFGRLPGPREVRRYPRGWHLLFRDLQAPQVWQDVDRWIAARALAPGPACTGAG